MEGNGNRDVVEGKPEYLLFTQLHLIFKPTLTHTQLCQRLGIDWPIVQGDAWLSVEY